MYMGSILLSFIMVSNEYQESWKFTSIGIDYWNFYNVSSLEGKKKIKIEMSRDVRKDLVCPVGVSIYPMFGVWFLRWLHHSHS